MTAGVAVRQPRQLILGIRMVPMAEPAHGPRPSGILGAGPPLPRISLLGGFALRIAGAECPLGTRAQRLLAVLALARGPLSRGVLAQRLWPDAPPERANASLRAALWTFSGWPVAPVVVEHCSVAVHAGVDVRCAEAGARALLDGSRDGLDPGLEQQLRLDILPDWTDDWLMIEREQYRQLRLHALEAVCRSHARAGRYAWAVDAGMAAVSAEPLRESAHRALIEAHLLEGNRVEALRQYHAYLRLAREEMGVGASPLLQRLFDRAVNDHAGTDRDAAVMVG